MNKVQKQYDHRIFGSLCCIALVFGVLTVQRTKLASSQVSTNLSPDAGFLSRDQTDEWKGWMQVLILIYHYTGASTVLPIYQLIRLFVASYLFMTGYGHTLYFLKKNDFSLIRISSVMIRLNMISVILPYLMDTHYTFYYFAPLTSFWYCIIYCTMRVQKQYNQTAIFVTLKVVTSASVTNFIIRKVGILENVVHVLGRCCNIHWDLTESRFRLSLDSFIVLVGMLCGLLYFKWMDAMDDDNNGQSQSIMRHRFQKFRIAALFGACATLPAFAVLAYAIGSKTLYNIFLPFISYLPILSYLILRNASSCLRNHYSAGFAWVGRISLETFTLQ